MPPPPRPHPLARGKLVGRLCRLLDKAWQSGWCTRPSLDPEALWAKGLRGANPAAEEGGRSASDAADFRHRLASLAESIQNEAKLNSLGLTIAHGQLTRVVRQRLALGALWIRRPEMATTPVAPPLIVVGQMRGGTSRIQRLFAADPAHGATRFCDSWHPVPTKPDLRPLWSGLALFAARQVDPWLDTLHPFGSTRPDEELGWLAAALNHCAYEAQWRIPGFTAFSESRDPAPVYREFARIFRTDAAHRGNASIPRVMKVPQFAEDLPELLSHFPNARVIIARRHIEDVVRSGVSLLANQMAMQSDHVDLSLVEAECRRKVSLRSARIDEALARWSGPVTEIEFDALDHDWESTMASAYRELSLSLTAEARAAMADQMEQETSGVHTAHRDDLNRFEQRVAINRA